MTPFQHYWRKPRIRYVNGRYWRLHPGAMGGAFPSGPYATIEHAYRSDDYCRAIRTIESYFGLTGNKM